MLSNYLKIAGRNLWKHKLFSFINMFGLASGLTVCLLAIMQVKGAFDYDRFHPHGERTYRILTDAGLTLERTGETMALASAPLPLGELLQQDYPFIERVVRVYYGLKTSWTTNERTLSVRGAFVDPAFYEVFGFRLAAGQPATAPQTVVLTSATAERFFGRQNPVGKTIMTKSGSLFRVTGVLAPAGRSHLRFDLLASMASVPLLERTHQLPADLTNWTNAWTAYTYVLLKPGVAGATLDQTLRAVAGRVKQLGSPRARYRFRTQPLLRISPGRERLANLTDEPVVPQLLAVGGLALAVLLLAGFNYVNLTMARSLSRSREVGVRKVIGAHRWQLMAQFITESVLLVLLALGLAAGMWQFIRPLAIVREISHGVPWDAELVLWCVSFGLLVGVLAGAIPARLLSRVEPAQTLKNQLGQRRLTGLTWRKALTVVQFAASLTAMIFVVVLFRQSRYMATTDYGFRRASILNVPLPDQAYQPLAGELARQAGVERVAAASNVMGHHADLIRVRRQRRGDSLQVATFAVDTNFIPAMGLTLLAGRNLPAPSVNATGDTTAGMPADRFVVVNETAVRALRLVSPHQAIGQTIWLTDSTEARIIGVVKDFHFMSFKFRLMPLVLRYAPEQFQVLQLQIAEGHRATVVTKLADVWKRFHPHEPFQAVWFDQALYDQHFHRDDQLFLGLLTGMALTIACLGLLGMVIYTTQTRTKEIGIRKVMGATVTQVVGLLSGSFVKLLLLAGAIALPAGYWLSQSFLQQYAYHIEVGAATLGLCLGALLTIGGLAIGSQTYRAARMNPVESLRIE